MKGSKVYGKVCRFASMLDAINIPQDASKCDCLIKGRVISISADSFVVEWLNLCQERVAYDTKKKESYSIFKNAPASYTVVSVA